MKITSIWACCTMALFLGACDVTGIRGNGHVVTDQRTISAFSEIHANGGLKIEWQSGPPALSIRTDENLLKYIESRNVGKKLELHVRERLRPSEHTKVTVSSPSLSGVKLKGAADLVAHGVKGQTFAVESTGAADLKIDGVVDELLADLTGASDLQAKNLQTRIVQMSTTGAADAWVNVSETLRVSITGAGDVTYSGNPKTIERHVTGAGSIHHKD